MSKPELIAIEHDDYHAKHIGRLPDGRQFFLTSPFVPAIGHSAGREFVALFLFDERGRFLEARIDDLGTRAELDKHRARNLYDQRLAELGKVEFCRIEVQPFEVERFDTTFGLVARPPEEEDDVWAVELQPGNYMAFFEPWTAEIMIPEHRHLRPNFSAERIAGQAWPVQLESQCGASNRSPYR